MLIGHQLVLSRKSSTINPSPRLLQRDSPDDSMKPGAGMVQDKRMDMGSVGDFNGVMGKNPGSRHQLHKESAMDRSPYYDKVRGTGVIVGLCGDWSPLSVMV